MKIYDEKIKQELITKKHYRDILDGICCVVSSIEDSNLIKECFVELLKPWITHLHSAKTQLDSNQPLTKEDNSIVINILDIMKVIVKRGYSEIKINDFGIFSQIFTEIWDIIKVFLTSNNYNILESVIQLIKYFMRGMVNEFKPFLKEYLYYSKIGYDRMSAPPLLYAFEISLTVYINDEDEETKDLLKHMLKELIFKTFNSYLTSIKDYNDKPQLSEDFFGLMFRITKLHPFFILESELFETLLYNSIIYLDVPHLDTSNNIIYFINKLIVFHKHKKTQKLLDNKEFGFYYEKMKNNVLKFGDMLVTKIINYLLTYPSGIVYDHLKDLIADILLQFPKEAGIWFSKASESLDSDILTNSEKIKMIALIESLFNSHNDITDPKELAETLNTLEEKFMEYIDLIYKRSLSKIMRSK